MLALDLPGIASSALDGRPLRSPTNFSAFWFSGIVFSAFGGLPRHSFFGFYNCKEHGFSLNGKRS
nr:MAG TPA: hypothetical protein [Caudoviricetes sp.]